MFITLREPSYLSWVYISLSQMLFLLPRNKKWMKFIHDFLSYSFYLAILTFFFSVSHLWDYIFCYSYFVLRIVRNKVNRNLELWGKKRPELQDKKIFFFRGGTVLPWFSNNTIVLCMIKLRYLKEHNVKVTACRATLFHTTETISHTARRSHLWAYSLSYLEG